MPRLHPLLLGKRSAWLSTFLDVLSICTINQSNGWCHTCTHWLIQNQYILLTQNNTQWPPDLFPWERVQDWVEENQKGEVPKVNEETAHAQRLSLFTNISQCFDQCSTKIWKIYTTTKKWILNEWHIIFHLANVTRLQLVYSNLTIYNNKSLLLHHRLNCWKDWDSWVTNIIWK